MALIEAVFRRKSSERTLTFQEIAEETHTQLAEVEHLVMKALRCGSSFIHRLLVGFTMGTDAPNLLLLPA